METSFSGRRIIDGDGHVMEDIAAIWKLMPPDYVGKSFSDIRGKSPFPPIDHLHSANRHFTPRGAFANVGPEGWEEFLQAIGIHSTVLYTSAGLSFGKIVSKDWAIELARAYNNWIYETYLSKSRRFRAMGLIPLQEPKEAAAELKRIVSELGFVGAMLPSTGANESMLMDDMSPYAPVNALGHPIGQMVAFAGIVFNGVLDKYPGVRIGFLEAGCGWLLTAAERFTRSWASHVQYDPRGRFLKLRDGESVGDYVARHVDEGRIFIGVEGNELTIAEAIRVVGNKPFVFSSDYPHEVDAETCKAELEELEENTRLTSEVKEAILYKNAVRFYQLAGY